MHLKRKLCGLHVPLNTGQSWFNLVFCTSYNKAHFCCFLTQRDSCKSQVERKWDCGSHRPWDSPVSLGSKSYSLLHSSVHSMHNLSPLAPAVRSSLLRSDSVHLGLSCFSPQLHLCLPPPPQASLVLVKVVYSAFSAWPCAEEFKTMPRIQEA